MNQSNQCRHPALDDPEPMHVWFELSHSSYLVLPRTMLQDMPREWQVRLVELLEEARARYDDPRLEVTYVVQLRGEDGRFRPDPLSDYRHPEDLVLAEYPPKGADHA